VGEAGALGTYGTRPSTALRTSAIAIGFDTAYILAVTTYYLGKTGFQRRNMITIFSSVFCTPEDWQLLTFTASTWLTKG
jgi:hypothetical protein